MSCCRYCPYRLRVALGNLPLGVYVLPSAIRRSASWCCPRQFAAWRLVLPSACLLGVSSRCLESVPISVWCTNKRTLALPCQNDPWRRHVPIGVPPGTASWCCPQHVSLVSHLGVLKVYQSAFGVPISVRYTNQLTLALPCQNDPRRRHVPIGVPWYKNTVIYLYCTTCGILSSAREHKNQNISKQF